ncbi:hypothetical protein QE152_g35315 [Popillia japonica]|uniref:Retrotransposon gag domain-containing protein n=1 Tax=Popillia japonica TaxID=7064 RepID=A0AAW1IG18_POPJA
MPRPRRSVSAGEPSTLQVSELERLFAELSNKLQANQVELKATQAALANILQTNQAELKAELKADLSNKLQASEKHILNQIADIQSGVNQKLDAIDTEVQSIRTQLYEQLTELKTEETITHQRLDTIHNIQEAHTNQITQLDERISNNTQDLTTHIQNLQQNMHTNIKHVQEKSQKMVDELKDLQPQLNHIHQQVGQAHHRINQVEYLTKETKENFSQETQDLQKLIERITENEAQARQQLRREMEKLKKQEMNLIPTEKTLTKLYLKPEMWPKFKGHRDKLHPMTYLSNICRLANNIANPDIALNLIRIFLEERALEWYESVSEHITNIEEFERAFRKQYWSQDQQDHTKMQLMTGRYRERPLKRETYACDTYNKCKHLTRMTEREIVQGIVRHFIITDPTSVVCEDIQNLDELMEFLRKLDEVTETQRNQRIQSHTTHSHQQFRQSNASNNYSSRSQEEQPSRSSEFFESVVRETKDRIHRDDNVIVYGVQEKGPETDAKAVKTLLKSVKPDITDIHSANIMGPGAATIKKPHPIRVVFTNPFVVRDILKNKSKLASITNYKEVFLKHDQTAYQRELYAKCRESLHARLSNGEKNLRIKFINGLPSVVAIHNSA